MFSTSDDIVMMKQIQATHVPDGMGVEVNSILAVLTTIEDVLRLSTPNLPGVVHGSQAQPDAHEEKATKGDFNDDLKRVAYSVNKISCEILCKCSGGGDALATTVAIFNILTNYSWEAKVVVALAALAMTYGEFSLVAHLDPTKPLAKLVALLKQLPDTIEREEMLKPMFDAFNNLITVMLDVTKCIIGFKKLPSQYIRPDMPTATADIPIAVYWTIRSIVACATQIAGLIEIGHEYIASTTDASELSSLAHKVSNMHSLLKKKLTVCLQLIEKQKQDELFQTIKSLFETPQVDNMKILKIFIYAKDNQPPLCFGSAERKASVDVLRGKNVLLFISDLDISHAELSVLYQKYHESRKHHQFEVVWLPVVDWSTPWDEATEKQFETNQSAMPWYSLSHPSFLDPAVIRYIKNEWRFNKKPMLVVLDPQGRVANPNALHMINIWGSRAFPFDSIREEDLWKAETWGMGLLADIIGTPVRDWTKDGKLIFLFGGEDIEWIRKFSKTVQDVAREANVTNLQMIYIGKSHPREKVHRNNTTIVAEKLSHTLQDLGLIRSFWVRLESMLLSKIQLGKAIEDDQIIREIRMMLSFDRSDQGWVVVSQGSAILAKAKGDILLRCFMEFDTWKDQVAPKGFILAMKDHLHALHSPSHYRLILPGTSEGIPQKVVCAECGCPMEKFIMYRCCND